VAENESLTKGHPSNVSPQNANTKCRRKDNKQTMLKSNIYVYIYIYAKWKKRRSFQEIYRCAILMILQTMKDVVSLSGYAGSHGASLPNAYSDSSSSKNEDKRKAINQTRNKYNAKTQDAPRFATDQNHFLQKIESANGENALRIYAAPGGGI